MSSFQKVIKYFAIALAGFIIVNIIFSMYYGISLFAKIMDHEDSSYISEELESLSLSDGDVLGLDIDVSATKLIVQTGVDFRVETNNRYVKGGKKNNRLYIKEKTHNLFRSSKNSELVVTIPEGKVFDYVQIETKAGVVQIESLVTKKLEMDLGAGKVSIQHLIAMNEAEIDGGAGEINILSGKIHQLDLDIGVGKFTLNSEVTGKSKIDAGVGEVVFDLIGNREDYAIRVSKGIGSVQIDGQNVADDSIVGNGLIPLEIDGGVGKIEVNFLKRN